MDRFSDQLTFPGRVIFPVLTNSQTSDAILAGEIDFGVTWIQPDSTEIMAKPLFTERYQIVVPKSLIAHPHFGSRPQENLEKLQKIACVTYKENDEVFRRYFSHYQMNADRLNVRRTTANYGNLVRMIEAGVGWSIVPIHYEISKNKNWILPISESAGLSKLFYLVYRKQIAKLDWARAAIQEVQGCFRG